MIRANHPLKQKIGKLVGMAHEGGLMAKWSKDYQPEVKRTIESKGPIKFKCEHIFPAIV